MRRYGDRVKDVEKNVSDVTNSTLFVVCKQEGVRVRTGKARYSHVKCRGPGS